MSKTIKNANNGPIACHEQKPSTQRKVRENIYNDMHLPTYIIG